MTSSLLVAQQSWIALRGAIPTVPIWMLTAALYAWIVPSATATGGGNCSSDDGDGDDDHVIPSNLDDGRDAAAARHEDDDDIVDWETTDHEDNESNDFVEEGNGDEEQEYNPTGLQIWPNGKISFRCDYFVRH